MGQDWSRLVKNGQDGTRWVKMGQDGSKWVKMGQDGSLYLLMVKSSLLVHYVNIAILRRVKKNNKSQI